MAHTALNALTPQIMRVSVDSVIGDLPFDLPPIIVDFLQLQSADIVIALLIAGAFILLCTIFAGICDYVSRISTAKFSEGFINGMRNELYYHIQKLPYSWHTDNATGDIIQRCTSDVEVVRNFASVQLLLVIRTLFLVGFNLYMMFSMNVASSLVSLLFMPIIFLYSMLFYKIIRKRFTSVDIAEGELTTKVQENLTGVRVVKAFGREKYEADTFDVKNDNWSKSWIKLGKITSIYWASGDFITGVQIMTVLLACVFQAVKGNITEGEFIAFMSYNAAMVWPVRGLGRVVSEMSKAGVSIERVQYILNSQQESSKENALKPDMNGDIVFENVNFNYKQNLLPVIKNVSFTAKSGKTIAILGGTGSGKSTIVHLLDMLYKLPEGCGKITVGDVDIRQIDLDWLRSNIGVVLQEPFLFSCTVKENICMAKKDATDEEMINVAKIACIHDSIVQMPQGYDTIVGEKGVTLSGGQKQRVAIARMLLQNTPIKIFDDSLSAVDTKTDEQIRNALLQNKNSSTVILISHRITTLMKADLILVLDKGEIVQSGTHTQLIKQNGIYQKIYNIQMRNEDRQIVQKG